MKRIPDYNVTVWMRPAEMIMSQWGTIPCSEWAEKEAARLSAEHPGAFVKTDARSGKIAIAR